MAGTAAREYPALYITSSFRLTTDRIDRLLADVDEESPTAVEELDDGVRLFFASAVHRSRAAIRLVALDPTITCEPVEVSDDDWAVRSQAQLGPVRIGRVVVSPPWSPPDDRTLGPQDIAVSIQPSMGFGTGHHASTRLCLALLQDVPLANAEVLDAGTGSGVLAITAARLGARRVVAIDVDDDALMAARENIERNGVDRVVMTKHADVSAAAGADAATTFDVVLANLTGAALVGLSSQVSRLIAPGGVLIASGFTIDEADRVGHALGSADLLIAERREEDGWVALSARRAA